MCGALTGCTPQERDRIRERLSSQKDFVYVRPAYQVLPEDVARVAALKLPAIVKELAMTKRGIIIFVGGTGTGKSTSLASMIGHRNANSRGHIITIEDPIEFIHQHNGCIVTQREVGIDTESFEIALKNTLRQAPDVILIGEIRTREVMDFAIAFAETGHLVLATLHANNANQALDRIIHFFPADRHGQLLMDLSLNLKGIVAQQLIPTPDGTARRACIEVLLNSPLVSDHIRKGEMHLLKELMKKSRELGMRTFDWALFELYNERHRTEQNQRGEPTTAAVLDELLREKGFQLPKEQLREAMRAMYAVTQTNWEAEQDAVPTLQELKRRGYRIGIISNAADDDNTQTLIDKARLRPYLEYIVSSAAFGKRKPDPSIFLSALDHFGIPAQEAVMVGDSFGADIVGAHRSGMQGIWITRRTHEAQEAGEAPAEAVVGTLAEIPGVLEGG